MTGIFVLIFTPGFYIYSIGNTLPYNCSAKVSFMKKWRKKGLVPSRNYSRLYFWFLLLFWCIAEFCY